MPYSTQKTRHQRTRRTTFFIVKKYGVIVLFTDFDSAGGSSGDNKLSLNFKISTFPQGGPLR